MSEQIHVLCVTEHKSNTAFISTISLYSEHWSPDCHSVGPTFVWAVQSFSLAGCFADLPELAGPFLIKAVHRLCTQNRTCVGFRFCKLRLKQDMGPSQLMGRMNTLSTKTLQLLWGWVKQLWGSVFKHRHAYVPWGFCFFPFFSSAVLRFWCSAWPSQPSPPVTAAVHCRMCCLSFLLEGWLLVTSSVTELHWSLPFSWI